MLHIKKECLVANNWSGGTTTQLFIYPNESSYKNIDFIFRVSTATIEIEESTFTILPGVNRSLMLLEGEITIHHKNQYSKTLRTFDVDSFSGDWHTTSLGKATDFNVMTRGSAIGSVQGLLLKEHEQKRIELNADFLLLYLYSGKLEVNDTVVNQGDLLVFEREHFSIKALSISEIAIARITL